MGRIALNGAQAAQILAIIAKQVGSETSLSKAAATLNASPKKEMIVVFTDAFGNSDVKPA